VADAGVDVFVVEAGLGGRYDATNVLGGGAVTVLTNISREHTELLGETEAEIAGEKLAVAPDGSDRLVIGRLDPSAADAVAAVMATHRLSGWRLGRDILIDDDRGDVRITVDGAVYPALRVGATGRFQRDNLALALGAAQRFLERPLDTAGVRRAAASVRVPGRLEVFAGSPDVAIDGAHNPAGMRALAGSLDEVFGARRPVAVVSVLDDKDLGAMLEAIAPRCAAVIGTRSSHRRAADPAGVAAAAGKLGAATAVVADPREAVAAAVAKAGPGGAVLVCGSLYLLGDVRPLLVAAQPGGSPPR